MKKELESVVRSETLREGWFLERTARPCPPTRSSTAASPVGSTAVPVAPVFGICQCRKTA